MLLHVDATIFAESEAEDIVALLLLTEEMFVALFEEPTEESEEDRSSIVSSSGSLNAFKNIFYNLSYSHIIYTDINLRINFYDHIIMILTFEFWSDFCGAVSIILSLFEQSPNFL